MPRELIERSTVFLDALTGALEGTPIPDTDRAHIAQALCGIAVSHGHALHLLLLHENPTSALALVRLNYEALVRANWVWFGADDAWVARFAGPVMENAEPAFPRMDPMLHALTPIAACVLAQTLVELKARAWDAMNSYTHGGQRQIARYQGAYDEDMLEEVVRTVNALLWYAARTVFHITENVEAGQRILVVYDNFQDCLHPRPAAGAG
jgi:hypothetical protein